MTDKTPVEMIEDMHKMMLELQATVKILDKNVKILQGKANGSLFPDVKIPATAAIATPQTPGMPSIKSVETTNASDNTTVVFGHIYNDAQKPLHGVQVKIIQSGKEVRTTKTNMAGKWMVHLSPGKYSIRYSAANMPPRYRQATVKPGMKELKVL